MPYNFDGKKYKEASAHQKEWGNKLISEFSFFGNEAILDLGCGDGVLTAQLADLVPGGHVVGIDASAGMIEEAKKRSRDNLTFLQMDINDIDFPESFDLIYSNAALHWIKDHRRLLVYCRKALKNGGTLKWSFAGQGNCANMGKALRTAISSNRFKLLFEGFQWPWYMPSVEEYRALSDGNGYSEFEITLENADRFFPNETEMIKWIDQPSIVPFLAYIEDDNDKKIFRDTVVELMVRKCRRADGRCFETFRRLKVNGRK